MQSADEILAEGIRVVEVTILHKRPVGVSLPSAAQTGFIVACERRLVQIHQLFCVVDEEPR